MDPKTTADKYMERGGYAHGERSEWVPADILAVANFIGWHDPRDMFGGYRAKEALSAFCRLIDFPETELKKIIGTRGG